MRRAISVFIFLFAVLTAAHAARPYRIFDSETSLSSGNIYAIYYDSDEMVWIATENGLNRYDGIQFTQYFNDPGDSSSIASNFVGCVAEDRDGNLYVGSHAGVQVYDRGMDCFSKPGILETGERYSGLVVGLAMLKNGKVVSTGSRVLVCDLRDDGLHLVKPDFPVPDGNVDEILEDTDGTLWYVTEDGGLAKTLPDGTFRYYLSGPDHNISDIHLDQKGDLYVGDLLSGLLVYNRESDDFEQIPGWGAGYSITKIAQNTYNDLFVCTTGDWVKTFNTETRTFSPSTTSRVKRFSEAGTSAVVQDRYGNVWIAAEKLGVVVVPAYISEFSYIGPDAVDGDAIGSGNVTSLVRTSDGLTWVGTYSEGIYVLDGERQVKHFLRFGTEGQRISAISMLYEDSRGNLWVGTRNSGCGILDRSSGRLRKVSLGEGVETRNVSCFSEDGDGHIWISTMGSGIFRYDYATGKVIPISDFGVDVPPHVTTLLVSSDKRLWYGSFRGVGCVDMNKNFREGNISDQGICHVICEAHDGVIWVGSDNGISRWDPLSGKSVHYTVNDGLPGNVVVSIEEDLDGILWLGTNRGLSRFDPTKEEFVNYVAEDGIQGNEFSRKASFRSPDGKLVFGGQSGITEFDPRAISNPSRRWNVRVTNIWIKGKPVLMGRKSGGRLMIDRPVQHATDVWLSHNDNSFTIVFSPLNYTPPERLRSFYRVNGEDEWHPAGEPGNRVTLSSVPPGKYVVDIRTQDNEVLSDITSVTFHVRRPWWLSWWSFLVYLLSLASLVQLFIILTRRNKQAKEQIAVMSRMEEVNEGRIMVSTELAHELRSPLSLIISPLQKLLSNDADSSRQKNYRIMLRNAERIQQLTDQLLEIRALEHGQLKMRMSETDIVTYIDQICMGYRDAFEQKGVAFSFDHEGIDSLPLWIDRQNFYKVIFNLLSFVLKHVSEGRSAGVRLRSNDKDAVISIWSSGSDMAEAERAHIFDKYYQDASGNMITPGSAGLGLNIVKSIVEQHHGSISVVDGDVAPGIGFVIVQPLGKAHLSPDEIAPAVEDVKWTPKPASIVSGQDPDSQTSPSKSKYHVFVIDDDEDVCRYLVGELSPYYHVSGFGNGKEALDAAFDKAPDLIVCDMDMPVMDGTTLCRRVKENINLNHIPFIMLSSRSGDQVNINALLSGADAFLRKPFSIDVLKTHVDNLLRSRTVLRNKFAGSQIREDKLPDVTVKTPDDQLMERVMRVINGNISSPDFTVEKLAEEVGISRVHIYRKLKELTNQSASDFIRNTRLTTAARLLSEGRQSISEVSRLVGFTNPDYFSTVFKKLYGKTPREYMNQPEENTK